MDPLWFFLAGLIAGNVLTLATVLIGCWLYDG